MKCLLISDFNIENLATILRNDPGPPSLDVAVAPYGQVQQVLLNAETACWKDEPDVAVVWTQPHLVVNGFHRLLQGESFDPGGLTEDVRTFAESVAAAAQRVGTLLLPSWLSPTAGRVFSALDMKPGAGPGNALLHMNLALIEHLEPIKNVHVLNAGRWMERVSWAGFSDKLWYMAKIPFGNDLLKVAADDLRACLRAVKGDVKKLIVVDLDDTLWGGILGDVGWENIVLGGHDYIGEAFVDFQQSLKAMTRRGLLLAIASKNEEDVVLEAFRKHPEMVLREEDFVGWRINWNDKANNIVDLVGDLNLGLQSVVFIDDNPVERARVRDAVPEVFVPEWPKEKTGYKRALLDLDCLNAVSVSDEDARRTAMYRSEYRRKGERKAIGSYDDWLESLGMVVTASELVRTNLPRATQLLNKTNQMNLRTRRLGEKELLAWAAAPSRRLWTFSVSDKFGDSGLTGIVSVDQDGDAAVIVDFVLSCRVMGRKVEQTMLHVATEHARDSGLRTIRAEFLPTPKNKPCLGFFESSGFTRQPNTDVFVWNTNQPFPVPKAVTFQVTASS